MARRDDPGRGVARRNREAILDGAERLLSSGSDASVAAVAKEAGVSRPTVYSHFANRADLIGALVERALARATDAIPPVDRLCGDPVASLEAVVSAGWEHLARHQDIARAAMGHVDPMTLEAAHRQVSSAIGDVLAWGRSVGVFRDDLPSGWLVAMCLALAHGARESVRTAEMDASQARDALVAAVEELWAPRRGGPRRRR
ncbi:MAG: TetR/AcrR family transcriptional regulator [Acidimicrobiales bacterium]